MSTDKGYIKLYRDIRDHWIWDEKPYDKGRAWIDLLMMVNHEDKKIKIDNTIVPVKRGMTITSLRKLADRWGWSIGKVSRFLDLLEQELMLRQERNTKRTTLSIVNYGDYQDLRNTKRNSHGTLAEQSRNTDGNKQYTKKNEEDTKEENPLNPPADTEEGWEPEDYDYDGNGWS